MGFILVAEDPGRQVRRTPNFLPKRPHVTVFLVSLGNVLKAFITQARNGRVPVRWVALVTILGLMVMSARADDVLSSEHGSVCGREWISFNRVEPGDRFIPVTIRKSHIFRMAFAVAGVNLGSIMIEP